MNRRHWAWAAATLAIVIGIAGCGEGDAMQDDQAAQPGKPLVTWGEPEGDSKPSLVVMLLHGGGWRQNLTGYRGMIQFGKALQENGYATVAIGYAAGEQGFSQIEYVYDRTRQRYPGVPICAFGQSAGGHLALMLATREPKLACVIDVAGPTDLTTLEEQGTSPCCGLPKDGHELAVDAFGSDSLAEWSPVRFADRINARVLMVMAETDPLVPVEQGEELGEALPGAQLIVLPPGPAPFTHSGVAAAAAAQANAAEAEFLASVAQGG